jgi:hypothetical protein
MARAKTVKEEENIDNKDIGEEAASNEAAGNTENKDQVEEAASNETAENSQEESGHIEIVLLGNIRHNGEKYKKGDSPVLPDETVKFLVKKCVAKKIEE